MLSAVIGYEKVAGCFIDVEEYACILAVLTVEDLKGLVFVIVKIDGYKCSDLFTFVVCQIGGFNINDSSCCSCLTLLTLNVYGLGPGGSVVRVADLSVFNLELGSLTVCANYVFKCSVCAIAESYNKISAAKLYTGNADTVFAYYLVKRLIACATVVGYVENSILSDLKLNVCVITVFTVFTVIYGNVIGRTAGKCYSVNAIFGCALGLIKSNAINSNTGFTLRTLRSCCGYACVNVAKPPVAIRTDVVRNAVDNLNHTLVCCLGYVTSESKLVSIISLEECADAFGITVEYLAVRKNKLGVDGCANVRNISRRKNVLLIYSSGGACSGTLCSCNEGSIYVQFYVSAVCNSDNSRLGCCAVSVSDAVYINGNYNIVCFGSVCGNLNCIDCGRNNVHAGSINGYRSINLKRIAELNVSEKSDRSAYVNCILKSCVVNIADSRLCINVFNRSRNGYTAATNLYCSNISSAGYNSRSVAFYKINLTAGNRKHCISIYIYRTFNFSTGDVSCSECLALEAGLIVVPIVNINCNVIFSSAVVYDLTTLNIKYAVYTNGYLRISRNNASANTVFDAKSLIDTYEYKRISCIVVVVVCGSNAMTCKIKSNGASNLAVVCGVNIRILGELNVAKKFYGITALCYIKSFLKCCISDAVDLCNSVNNHIIFAVVCKCLAGSKKVKLECGVKLTAGNGGLAVAFYKINLTAGNGGLAVAFYKINLTAGNCKFGFIVYKYRTDNLTACNSAISNCYTVESGVIMIPVICGNCNVVFAGTGVFDSTIGDIKHAVYTNGYLRISRNNASANTVFDAKSLIDTYEYKRISCIVVVVVCGSNAMTCKIKSNGASDLAVVCGVNIRILGKFNVIKKFYGITALCCIKSFLKGFIFICADLCYKNAAATSTLIVLVVLVADCLLRYITTVYTGGRLGTGCIAVVVTESINGYGISYYSTKFRTECCSINICTCCFTLRFYCTLIRSCYCFGNYVSVVVSANLCSGTGCVISAPNVFNLAVCVTLCGNFLFVIITAGTSIGFLTCRSTGCRSSNS